MPKKISAKRHSLMCHTEEIFPFYGARSRAPTGTSSFQRLITSTDTQKNAPKGRFRVLVEVVRVELTSYSAAKKLSTYLVYLLFLNRFMRVNTPKTTQKAEYSSKNTFRFFQEGSA